MKIIRFSDQAGAVHWGVPSDEGHAVVLAGSLFDARPSSAKPMAIANILAPLDPPNVIAIGRNYREHATEMKAEPQDAEPLIFLKATSAVTGPNDDIILPQFAPSEVDYEAELAVIIARRCKNVPEREAMSVVLGFTCANDVSARDCQKRRDKQWARGKSFDTFCPLGPVILTPDEFPASGVAVRSFLNGQRMQDGHTSDMIFSVAQLVSYVSHQFTLLPGTVILTGTPAGVGAARTPPVFLRDGDEMVVEVEGIGRLCNHVRAFPA